MNKAVVLFVMENGKNAQVIKWQYIFVLHISRSERRI